MDFHLSAARLILATPRDKSSWDVIREKHDSFIWTDDDTVEQWNKIAVKRKLPKVVDRVDSSAKDEREFLTYKEKTIEVPLTHSRDDRLVIVYTLGHLVRQDSDIRFCLDSYHSSDLAFLALPPADWKALESKFGKEAVAYRFLTFPTSLKEFWRQAFSEKNNREYPADIPDTSAQEQMARELADYTKELAQPHCPSVEVSCELLLPSYPIVHLTIKTKTDKERDALSHDRKRVKRILDTAKKRCAEHDLNLSIAYIQSHESVKRDWAGDWHNGTLVGYNILTGEPPSAL